MSSTQKLVEKTKADRINLAHLRRVKYEKKSLLNSKIATEFSLLNMNSISGMGSQEIKHSLCTRPMD